jgi:outer membrane immunogenic protein
MQRIWGKIRSADPVAVVLMACGVVLLLVGFWAKPAKAEGIAKSGLVPIGEVVANTSQWTGLYAGVGGGYQVSDTSLSATGFSLDGISGRGWAGDARLGFDWQATGTPFVVGLLGGYNIGEAKSEAHVGPATASATLTPSWYVGGRLGFALPSKTLVYGGAAWQRAEGKLGGVLSGSATEDGIMYIAGIEQMVSPQLTLGVEYSLSQYEFCANCGTGGHINIEPDVHAFKARLNWRPFAK